MQKTRSAWFTRLIAATVAVFMVVPSALALDTGMAPLVYGDYASPNPYDPNSGFVTIYYNLNTNANVTVEILDGSTVIRNLLDPTNQSAGAHTIAWDGKSGGVLVSEKTYNYRITANNLYGTSTESGAISVDYATPPCTAPVVSGDYATPNPFDPDSDWTTIYYTLNTGADVTVKILDGSTEVRNLGTIAQTSGSKSIAWDGKISGVNAAEKTYTYSVYATNSCGSTTETGSVTVDYVSPPGTAPVISNDYATPNPFDPTTQSTTIYYTMNTGATVTVSILDGSTVVRTLGTSSVSSGVNSIVWDGKISGVNAAEKSYTYRIDATNSYGSTTESGSVTVDYVNQQGTAPVISNDYASPNPFNPNTQSTTVYYTLNTTANVTVTIMDGSSVIETLAGAGSSQSSGSHSVSWDGRDSSNNAFANKTYTYRIDASNTYGSDVQNGNVTVDTSGSTTGAPNITSHYVTPSPFDPDDDNARINFSIDKTADVTVEILDGGTVIRTLASGVNLSAGNYNYYWNGDDKYGDQVDNGTYTYRIKASNSYGTDTETGTVRVEDDDNDDGNNDDDYGDLINDIRVDNAVFDPTDDERAKLLFDVEEDNVDITVEILDGNSVIRTLVDDVQYDESNDNAVYWNGKDKDGDIVDDDVYRFRITATKSGDTERAYRYTEVDTDGIIIGFPDDDNDNFCAGFVDVPEDNPYCKAIELMKLKGIFAGYPDGTFRIYEPINRAETTKVVLLAIGYSIMGDDGTNLGFWDVVKRAWYMPYLRTAKSYGIINGYPDGAFRPGNVPNRVELLKIFLEGTGINIPYCDTAPFKDTPVNYETRWYIDYVCFAANNALMYGDGAGNFNPAAPMARGDVAMLFYNFYVRGLYSQMNPYYGYGYTGYAPYAGYSY